MSRVEERGGAFLLIGTYLERLRKDEIEGSNYQEL